MSPEHAWSPHGVAADSPGLAPFPDDVVEAAARQDLGSEYVFLAWDLARLGGQRPLQELRALLLVALATLAAQREGSTRVPLVADGYLERLLQDLGTGGDQEAVAALVEKARRRADPGLAALIGGPGDYCPLLLVGEHLQQQRLFELEQRVARSLATRLPAAQDGSAEAAVREAVEETEQRPAVVGRERLLSLSEEQKDAVVKALTCSLTVVTGGPGTGKTSVVVAILRTLARLGDPPLEAAVLAAPTGRAADRMRRAVETALGRIAEPGDADRALSLQVPEAVTLHRLLGYSPGRDRFLHHENNPLAQRLVVVDESSMLDLFLADRLLRSLQPQARLVLLGDAQQLPSVEAGAFFRDLCAFTTSVAPELTVSLTRNFRMDLADPGGRRLLAVAEAVRRGDGEALFRGQGDEPPVRVREEVKELDLAGVELLAPGDAAQRQAFLERWERECTSHPGDREPGLDRTFRYGDEGFDGADLEALATLFRQHEASRILCVTRVAAGGTGSEAINAWFRARTEVVARGGRRPDFYPGEPVLMTQNDYGRRLYNGDQGLILRVAPGPGQPARAMAVFPRGDAFVPYPLAALRGRLELAWAVTVHKAQGSEYDRVALILPQRDLRLLTRELLYTAVTRARRAVTIIGSRDLLLAGVDRQVERYSGILDALHAA